MAKVEFKEVTKEFADGVRAVDNLNLEIDDGEFVVLVGPSGCGKTTALRMTAGLEAISEGTISIGGRVVNGVPSPKRDIAMVFQNYALYPHMSVFENMAFGLQQQRLSNERSKGVYATSRIYWSSDSTWSRKPRALSGGQRQRVAMGRAIVREPAVFLMDEPLSNLDAKLRVQMRAEIRGLQREIGTTTIYVTHDQVEAMTMGDRVAVSGNRRSPAGRDSTRALPPSDERVRRRVHRQPGDEPVRGSGRSWTRAPARQLRTDARRPHGRLISSQAPAVSSAFGRKTSTSTAAASAFIRASEAFEDLGAEVIAYLEAESAVATSRHIRSSPISSTLPGPSLDSPAFGCRSSRGLPRPCGSARESACG